jgi:hypothetical protein
MVADHCHSKGDNMGKTNEIATRTEQVELTSPNQILEFATSLKDMIVNNKLFTVIKGKNYVNVEGWQIAGAFTGTFPVVEKVEALPSNRPGEYKYRAEVSLRNSEGNMVGYGVAICSNKEAGKSAFDEYAVASMAQTRAVGKAFRMKIGWLLKVAGYETTPAEEMDAVEKSREAETSDKPKIREISYAIDKLAQTKSLDELKDTYTSFDYDIKVHRDVIAMKDEMKAKLVGQTEVVTASNGGEDGVE